MSASPGTPLVSVVVVNFNGRRHLERCLPALFATAGVEFEVIVVDNGSTDGSVEWLAERWPQARVLALGENLGFGRANGRGVHSARGEFVAFVNNDTVVDPDWLAALLEPLRLDPEVAASCATLRLLEFPELLNARGGTMTSAGYGYDIDFMVPAEREPVGHDSGPWHDVLFPTAAAALIRTEEFLAVGGFDPAMFMYHEDVDLGVRLWLMGRRVVVCDRALVYHAFGGTSHQAHGLRWRERLGMRHNVRTLLKCYRPVSLLRVATRIARIWFVHRAFGQAFWVCWWNLLHLPTTLAERRRLQKRRVRNEGDLYRQGADHGGRVATAGTAAACPGGHRYRGAVDRHPDPPARPALGDRPAGRRLVRPGIARRRHGPLDVRPGALLAPGRAGPGRPRRGRGFSRFRRWAGDGDAAVQRRFDRRRRGKRLGHAFACLLGPTPGGSSTSRSLRPRGCRTTSAATGTSAPSAAPSARCASAPIARPRRRPSHGSRWSCRHSTAGRSSSAHSPPWRLRPTGTSR